MKFRINFDGIFFNQSRPCGIVSFTLDTLDFTKKLSEQFTQTAVVVDFHKCLPVAFHKLHNFLRRTFFQHPFGNELAVTHMSFLHIFTRLDSHQLGHKPVKHIFIIFSLVGIRIIQKAKFNQTGVSKIIQRKQVCTGLFKGRTVGFEGVRVNTR